MEHKREDVIDKKLMTMSDKKKKQLSTIWPYILMVENQCHCPPHTYYVQLIIVVQNFSHSYRLQLAQHLQRGNNSRSTINYVYIPGFGIQSCATTNHSIKGFGSE